MHQPSRRTQPFPEPVLVSVPCDLCGSTQSREVFRKHGRVTGHVFRIVRCLRCSLVYVNPRLRDEQIALLYGDAYFRGEGFDPGVHYADEDDPHMRRAIRAVLQNLRETLGTLRGKTILDVGCGGGSLVSALCSEGASALGIDSSAEAARICAARSIPMVTGDVLSARLPESSFDAVTAIEVIEHVTSPTNFLEGLRALLKPGGIALIATGNWELVRRLRGTPYIMPEGHLYYFTPRTLRAYFRKTGFMEAAAIHRLWFIARLSWTLARLTAGAARMIAPEFGPFPIGQRAASEFSPSTR